MSGEEYPSKLLERAVSEFSKLPGIGRKTALRLILWLLRQDSNQCHALADSLKQLKDEVKYCKVCHNLCDTDLSEICANPHRDSTTICVVENIQNVLAIENTGQFRGLYHVLGGVISPMDGIGPNNLEMESLFKRVAEGNIKEIILALNPTMEGDTTNFYISRKLAETNIKLTVLARGINVGDELEYTDEVTLGRSIIARVELTKYSNK